MTKITGYIIANKNWQERIKLEMGARTFADYPASAWSNFIGVERANSIDRPTIIQRWLDKGWMPIKVTLEIDQSGDPLEQISDILSKRHD